MMRAVYVLALSVLHACSPSAADDTKDTGRADAAQASPPDSADIDDHEGRQPCQRTAAVVLETDDGARTWRFPLPCRTYDRLRDDPYPAP